MFLDFAMKGSSLTSREAVPLNTMKIVGNDFGDMEHACCCPIYVGEKNEELLELIKSTYENAMAIR